TRMRLVSEKPSSETMDAVAFAQERLGFEPDEEQARALRGGKRGIVLCSRQWGEIHCDGGEGCASSDFRSGQPDPAAESVFAPEWGVSVKGGGVCQPAGDQSTERREQPELDPVS